MKNIKKILAVLLAVIIACVAFSACSKSTDKKDDTTKETATVADFDAITKKGKLVVGITDYAPMDYKESKDGEWVGFDADFANMIGEKMGVDVEFVEIDWDNKFVELDSKSIDCIWNGMTITDEVTNNASATDAYAKNEQVVVMAADKVKDYTDVESLKDLTFAVESGSAGESAAEDNGLEATAVTAQTDALMEVKAGSVDACIIDSTMAQTMTAKGSAYEKYALGPVLTNEQYGVAFRKGSDMTAKMNQYIKDFKADGTLQKLSDKYGVQIAD